MKTKNEIFVKVSIKHKISFLMFIDTFTTNQITFIPSLIECLNCCMGKKK